MAQWLRPLIFSALNRSPSHRCGFEPSSGRVPCETRQVRFAGGQVVFLGDLPFSPHLAIDSAQMSEIIKPLPTSTHPHPKKKKKYKKTKKKKNKPKTKQSKKKTKKKKKKLLLPTITNGSFSLKQLTISLGT